jgi:hypothetical protein
MLNLITKYVYPYYKLNEFEKIQSTMFFEFVEISVIRGEKFCGWRRERL